MTPTGDNMINMKNLEIAAAIKEEWSDTEHAIRALKLSYRVKMALRAAAEEYAYRRAAVEIGDGTDYDTETALQIVRENFGVAALIQDLALGKRLL